MKKISAFILVVICCFMFIACGDNQTPSAEQSKPQTTGSELKGNKQDYFNAEILAIRDDYIKVKCLDVTKGGITEGTKLNVTKNVISAGGIPDIKVGDTIRVVYTGIKETNPPQLQTVFAIYAVDDEGNVIP